MKVLPAKIKNRGEIGFGFRYMESTPAISVSHKAR